MAEQRVASTPKTVESLVKAGFKVVVETGAGVGASFSDEQVKRGNLGVTC